MNTRIIISLGGSIIIPKTGFDPVFLKSFRKTIESEIAKGRTFVLIVGGGATARQYQEALTQTHKVSNEDLDWMGIATTKVNAELVRLLFRDVAYSKVLHNPTEKVRTSKPLIIASGWKPGNSTDLVAVQFAKTYGATHVINLSNIEYVYDKDPAVFSDAKKIETIGWKEFQTLVGTSWRPGSNLPFDPIATKEARRLNLQVRIVRGTSLKDVRHAITGKSFVGTTIG